MISEEMKKNILIVDDEEMIIHLLQDYFSMSGYDVTVAGTAEEAIKKLNNNKKFNLVISDIRLPGKSGFDLLNIINATMEDLPVILLTGLRTVDTAISALKNGAKDFITKPFDLSSVQKTVDRVLKKHNRTLKKAKVYEHLKYFHATFRLKTGELDPGDLAKELTNVLQKAQFASQEEIKQYELVFTEALLNAIEHGNLELSSSVKSNDLLQLAEFEELKEKRLRDPEYVNKKIEIIFEYNPELFSLTVKDEGPGFDWKKFIQYGGDVFPRKMKSHGRGLMIIKHIIDEIHFNSKGNVITLIKNKPDLEN